MDAIVHFEIPADDVERAQSFYNKLFGWKINSAPGMGYTLLNTTATSPEGRPTKPGAINGGLLKRQAPIQNVVITINVSDIDAAEKAIVKAGGSIVRKKQSVGPMGFASYFRDPEGNVLGLWQNAPPSDAKATIKKAAASRKK